MPPGGSGSCRARIMPAVMLTPKLLGNNGLEGDRRHWGGDSTMQLLHTGSLVLTRLRNERLLQPSISIVGSRRQALVVQGHR